MQSTNRSLWNLTKAFGFLVIPVVFCFVASAADKEPNMSNPQQQCRTSVQEFYTWYSNLAKNNSPKTKSPLEQAVVQKASCFSPSLLSQLKEDIKASSENPGEVVGLDFDPILNSQDIATPYKVEEVAVKDAHYFAKVYGTLNGKKCTKPDVTPELVLSGGKWTFVNFHYDQDKPSTDLLEVLKQLRAERKSLKLQKKK